MKFTYASAVVLCSAALAVAASAQSTGMAQNGHPMGQDTMGKNDAKEVSYTGCLEAGGSPGTFILSHVVAGNDRMGKDAMARESSTRSPEPVTLELSSQAVDLSKHVGHKVTVSGTATDNHTDHMKKDSMAKDSMAKDGMATHPHAFAVRSLTMIAASCR
jgi:hypothetical protein